MTDFLHGVETQILETGGRSVPLVTSNVIGLVGFAPIHHALRESISYGSRNALTEQLLAEYCQKPILIRTPAEARRYFYKDIAPYDDEDGSYSIPEALDLIFAQGANAVQVVNVFNPMSTDMSAAQTDSSETFGTSNEIALTYRDVFNVVITFGSGTFVEGVHYRIDYIEGKIIRIPLASGGIGDSVTLSIAYRYATPDSLAAANIVGVQADFTGIYAFLKSRQLFGYSPKILIAPRFSNSRTVFDALNTLANMAAMRSIAIIDLPSTTSIADAVASRGAAGSIDMNIASERIAISHTWYNRSRPYDAKTIPVPGSPILAGIWQKNRSAKGLQHSLSNIPIAGILSPETDIITSFTESNADNQALNAAGIISYLTGYGLGYRTWGLRNSTFPSASGTMTFLTSKVVLDYIQDVIEAASLPFVDSPPSKAQLDDVVETCNRFLRKLRSDGMIAGGECWFDETVNTVEEMSNGHYTFSHDAMPVGSMERMTHQITINTAYLSSFLNPSNS